MKLKDYDIELLKWAVSLAISEINNEIVTCPDPEESKEELLVLENQRTRLQLLREKIK